MYELVQWIGFAFGFIMVIATWKSIINTLVLPRMVNSTLTYTTWRIVQKFFQFISYRLESYKSKDRWLAYLGPISLLVMLASWLVVFFFGYALMLWPLLDGDFGLAMHLSGSSMLTLGVTSSKEPLPIFLEFIAAASGLIVVALQIGYLPTIYSAYNRRETLVATIYNRGIVPTWGPEILTQHQGTRALSTLPALFASWEAWAADISESHCSYPSLLVFRSQNPLQSWVVSWLAVLDAAALYLSLAPAAAPPEAIQCVRSGFVSFYKINQAIDSKFGKPPEQDVPIELSYENFVRGVEYLSKSGFAIEQPIDIAWNTFRGWRVNYEKAAYILADFTVAVPAPWSGHRKNMEHQDVFNLYVNSPHFHTPSDTKKLPFHKPHSEIAVPSDQGSEV